MLEPTIDDDRPREASRGRLSHALRAGDVVNVTFRGVVAMNDVLGPTVAVRIDDGQPDVHLSVSVLLDLGYDVTVTVPIDHPSNDKPGSIRSNERDVWVKTWRDATPDDTYKLWWNIVTGEETDDGDERLRDVPITGWIAPTTCDEHDVNH